MIRQTLLAAVVSMVGLVLGLSGFVLATDPPLVKTAAADDVPHHAGKIRTLAVSHDGKILASSAVSDSGVFLWDARTGKLLFKLEDAVVDPQTIRFSADDTRLLAAGYMHGVTVHDLTTRKRLRWLRSFYRMVLSADISPDGTQAVTGEEGTVLLWDLTAVRDPRSLRASSDLVAVATVLYSKDGKRVYAFDYERGLRIWNAANGEFFQELADGDENQRRMQESFNGYPGRAKFALAPDGLTFATSGVPRGVRLWTFAGAGKKPKEKPRRLGGAVSFRNDLQFSPDGKCLYSWNSGRDFDMIRPAEERQFRQMFLASKGGIEASVFLPDGSLLVTGNEFGAIELWDPKTFAQVSWPPSKKAR